MAFQRYVAMERRGTFQHVLEQEPPSAVHASLAPAAGGAQTVATTRRAANFMMIAIIDNSSKPVETIKNL
jgi:hypothetical protein